MAFLPVAAAVLGAAGTLFSGVSAYQQGRYQSQVAKNNAKIAEQNAARANTAAQIEQQRSDREYGAQEAQALAAQSASGLDVLGRSQFLSRENIHRVRGEAAKDIRLEGDANVRSLLQDAANFRGEASAAKLEGTSKLIGSAFSAGSSLLGSARSTKKVTRRYGS